MIPRATRYPLVLETMGGLGDCIYARPFIRAWCMEEGGPVWVVTPWPQLFTDIGNARFAPPSGMKLRTQQKNMAVSRSFWDGNPPSKADWRTFTYRLREPGMTIMREIEVDIGAPVSQPFIFDLPDFGPSPIAGSNIAVVRPVTVRKEWANAARNPDPQYVARAAEILRAEGYTVVVVGDVDSATEPALEPIPVGDHNLLRGELGVMQLMALMQHAAVIVGGIGFIVPAAIAMQTPAVFINGGQGKHNGKQVLTDPRMDCSRVRFIEPDRFCMCSNMRHGCNKVIRGFDARFMAALHDVTQRAEKAA